MDAKDCANNDDCKAVTNWTCIEKLCQCKPGTALNETLKSCVEQMKAMSTEADPKQCPRGYQWSDDHEQCIKNIYANAVPILITVIALLIIAIVLVACCITYKKKQKRRDPFPTNAARRGTYHQINTANMMAPEQKQEYRDVNLESNNATGNSHHAQSDNRAHIASAD